MKRIMVDVELEEGKYYRMQTVNLEFAMESYDTRDINYAMLQKEGMLDDMINKIITDENADFVTIKEAVTGDVVWAWRRYDTQEEALAVIEKRRYRQVKIKQKKENTNSN